MQMPPLKPGAMAILPQVIHKKLLLPSPNAVTPPAYHARVKHRKTRTGCRVCKIRRVKCDETKPACCRCTSTGRKCDGYPYFPPPRSQGSSSTSPAPNPDSGDDTLYSLSLHHLSVAIPGGEIERRSFSYLRERAIYDISGYFESEFWDRLVLQIGHTEPPVRHALLALSSLCETYESKSLNQELTEDRDKFGTQFALQQYNKAVRLLTEYISSSETRLEVILTSCLVFVWLELMRNDFDAGLQHLHGGLKILEDFLHPKTPGTNSQHIDACLINLFRRLDLQETVHGSPTSDFSSLRHEAVSDTVPSFFSSIEQARNSLYTLLDNVFRFVRQIIQHPNRTTTAYPPLTPTPNLTALQATCDFHLAQFLAWDTAIQNSPASTFTSLSLRQTAAMALLHLYHKLISLLLSTLLTPTQMIYDQYDTTFSSVLTHAEFLITTSQTNSPKIVFDMGVMAPLFYLILKCRNLVIRRKAISLLKIAPQREGMWYRPDVVRYVEWKVGIEERGRGELGEEEALPEEARIWNEWIRQDDIGGRERTVISFQRKREGKVVYEEEVTDLSVGMGYML